MYLIPNSEKRKTAKLNDWRKQWIPFGCTCLCKLMKFLIQTPQNEIKTHMDFPWGKLKAKQQKNRYTENVAHREKTWLSMSPAWVRINDLAIKKSEQVLKECKWWMQLTLFLFL